MFLVQCEDSCEFRLDEDEWNRALRQYPALNKQDDFLNFYPQSPNAWIEPKKDNYFDNTQILKQFERLFILLKFKKIFKNCSIEVLVDNARTHSAKIYDPNGFNKNPGTNCAYKAIEWKVDGKKRSVSCVDRNGSYRGLVEICKDLGLLDRSIQPNEIKLPELRTILASHEVFEDENSHLEKLASKYKVKILWCPKYHCELNPIEGLWCHTKRYVRKNNDQDFNKLNNVIIEAIDNFKCKNMNIKLWNRFWRAIEMYENNATYQEVLCELFGAKSKGNVLHHRKNKDFNTNI
jgi:hypothetical protein